MILDKWPLFQILPGQVLVIIELALGLEEILEKVYSILYWTLVFKKKLYKIWTQSSNRHTLRHTNSGVAGTNLHTRLFLKIFLSSILLPVMGSIASLFEVCS